MERISQQPVLEGQFVRLEPLSMDHLPGLCSAGLDPALWKFVTTNVTTEKAMEEYVTTALRSRDRSEAIPFAIVTRAGGEIAGSTRFANIDPANRRVEIGWTWIGAAWQRTVVNTETKYLMLSYAFSELNTIRVEFKTDVLNERSRRALIRIGAKEEGTLRRHMVLHDGRVRDTVYFSILDSEWEAVRERLRSMIFRSSPGGGEGV